MSISSIWSREHAPSSPGVTNRHGPHAVQGAIEVYLRKSMPGYSQASIEKLTAVVTELRDKPLNVHNTQTRRIAHGPTVSASLFDAHLRQWNATGCGPSLENRELVCCA